MVECTNTVLQVLRVFRLSGFVYEQKMQNEEGKYAIHRDAHNKMTLVCLKLN